MTIKLFLLAVLFVISGGAAFSEYFKGHKFLSLLAMIVATIATFYLFQDIYEDIYDDLKQPHPSTQSPTVPDGVATSEVEPFPPVVVSESPPKKIPPAKITKGDFAAYFEPKQDMFETTEDFQARRHQLLKQFNQKAKQRNLDYQAGVLRLTTYNADTQMFAVNLYWQADWVKRFFGEFSNQSVLKIGTRAAKQIYREGTDKPLFITANLKNNQVYIQGLMVEKGRTYSINLLPQNVFRDRLKDGSLGPEMVRIPAGTFRMGDIQGGGDKNEQPVHRISVKKFAMGRYEVTFAEYDNFAQATGREKPNDQGWGRGNRPVINVSWNDATAYTEWLSQQTGQTYRLPTEAEWEYAARAGSETKYWWGNEIASNKANCGGNDCGDDFEYTAPVGSFAANAFGLYDTAGNVWEWTCSEYEDRYKGKEKRCLNKKRANNYSLFVLRGGSWNFDAGGTRSAFRIVNERANRYWSFGFRPARLL